jgi:hypothetical protein
MICSRCTQPNPEEAAFCNRCGQTLASDNPAPAIIPDTTPAITPTSTEAVLWRRFIGPRADYYLERFRKFRTAGGDRFAPTWNWAPFLCAGDAWLWYLYRKMYLHAAVFLFGGLLPLILGAGVVGVVIWNIFAAVVANYLYYMHVKLNIAMIERRAGFDTATRDRLITEAGGIQPYVWWLGAAAFAIKCAALFGVIEAPSLPAP